MVNTDYINEAVSGEDEVYINPPNFSIQRAGVEVYETDEDNYLRYSSPYNLKAANNINNADVANENLDDSEDDSESMNAAYTSAYTLHQGEIVNTFYYSDLNTLNFESDYKEMTSNGEISRFEVNLNQFYKGVKIKLISDWEEPGTTLDWGDLDECMAGFITEQTFKEDGIDVKISGMSVLLEQSLNFEFSQLPRSMILYEIIKSAGLTPIINATGLDDDIIDFKNEIKISTPNTSSNTPIGKSSGQIGALAQQICQGKTTALAKAQTIHTFIANHVEYPTPNYTDHRKCPTEVLRSGFSNCCDRARLGHEMANAVGLVNRGVHGPNHVWVQYQIDNQWVDSDPSGSRPNLGSVWQGMSMDSVWTFEEC